MMVDSYILLLFSSFDDLAVVPLIVEDEIVTVATGFSYYAVLTSNSNFYLWSSDLTGRAKHGKLLFLQFRICRQIV